MMLATAASETSADNENRPQPNNLKEVFNIRIENLVLLYLIIRRKYEFQFSVVVFVVI